MAAPSPRAPLAWLLIPLVAGYLAASGLPAMPVFLALCGTGLCCAALATAWSRTTWVWRSWPLLALAAGTFLAGGYFQHRLKPPPGWEGLPPREAVFTLTVGSLFSSSSAGGRVHGFAVIEEAEGHLAELIGRKVYFSTGRAAENELWARSTRLRTTGILEALVANESEEDLFVRHLVRSGAQFQYRLVSLREEAIPGRGFFAFCARQSERFESYLRRGAPDGLSSVNVYVAMLLGKRAELSETQETAFLESGTLHLFAISGLHIGVIAFALHNFLSLLRVPQKPAAVIGLTLLLCFVGITGAAPSATRAFLMVLFFWGARFTTRAPNPAAALANSAFLVLLIFPGQLWSPGFQLSYSVVAGILFLGLPLGRHLQEKWAPFAGLPADSLNWLQRRIASTVHAVSMTFAISLSATLLSSPLSIHYFGIFSPGAVFINLLLIPAAALVIVAGFISVSLNLIAAGMFGVVFNHAGWLILILMEAIAKAAPSLPLFWGATFFAPWVGPLSLSIVMVSLLVCAHRQWKAPFFHFVTPFLVFVLLLSAAARLTFLGD